MDWIQGKVGMLFARAQGLAAASLCMLALAGCQAAAPSGEKALSEASKRGDGIYGISPETMQLKASAKSNYVNLAVYNSSSGSLVPLTTNFNTGYITSLLSNRSYSIKAFGVNASGVESAAPIAQYNTRTWDTFNHSTWGVSLLSEDSTSGSTYRITWNYFPWNLVPAGDGAKEGALMRCYFIADAGPGTDPFVSGTHIDALLQEGRMDVPAGALNMNGAIRIGCEAIFIDGVTSPHPTTYVATYKPAVGLCPQSSVTVYDQAYSCTVAQVAPSVGVGYALALGPANTCSFLAVVSGNIVDSPFPPSDPYVGTCNLQYKLTGPDGDSDYVSRSVTVVNRRAAFTAVPSPAPIHEISREDTDPAMVLSSGAPNYTALESASRYAVHVTDGQIQTDKETYGALAGLVFGSYRVDNTTNTNCARAGRIYYKNGSTKVDGVNPVTGEFYFLPKEHFYGTCTVDVFFDDGHPANNLSLTQSIPIAVIGWNDKPVLTGPLPNGGTWSCEGKCYVGIDYDIVLQANTGGKNDEIPANSGETDQDIIIKSGNCISSHPAYLKVNYCQLDAITKNITVSFLPIEKPPLGVDVKIIVRASDNAVTTMLSAAEPNLPGTSSQCLMQAVDPTACSAYPSTHLDSIDFEAKVDIAKFRLPMEPALIVSKAACISCHASVQGDFITDFGNTPPGATLAGGNPLGRFYNMFFKADETPGIKGGDDSSWHNNRATHLAGFRSMKALSGELFTKRASFTEAGTPSFMGYLGYQSNGGSPALGRNPSAPSARMPNPTDLVTFLNAETYWWAGAPYTDGYVNTPNRWVSECDSPTAPSWTDNGTKVCSNRALARDTLRTGERIDYMTISAPLVSDIRKIAQKSSGGAALINWINAEPTVQPMYRIPTGGGVEPRPFSGLSVVQLQPAATTRGGNSQAPTVGKYVSNTEGVPIECYGDVVVKGNLFLASPDFISDSRGCRIHVTGDVIFWGHNGSTPGVANPGISISGTGHVGVQITSASAISFGLSQNQLANSLRALPTSIRTFASDLGVPVGNECYTHNSVLPRTGTACPTGYAKMESAADTANLPPGLAGWDHALISYSGLMVNAPVVQSRYVGDFQGSIIADYALFRLGKLKFIYDPVFNNQVPFPRLQNITSDTGQPRVIFNAGQCNNSPSDSWECNPNAPQ